MDACSWQSEGLESLGLSVGWRRGGLWRGSAQMPEISVIERRYTKKGCVELMVSWMGSLWALNPVLLLKASLRQ